MDEVVNDLMLDQVGPCSPLKFDQGGIEEGFQLWSQGGIDRHGVEGTEWGYYGDCED